MVELLLSLAISAMVLTAVMVALDASFRAYASAAEQAATQSAVRMITNRLLMLIRTSTAHGPLVPETGAVLSGDTITSDHIELIDPNGDLIRIEYRPATQELWMLTTVGGVGTPEEQPLLGGVRAAQFFTVRRQDDDGVWVLDRATMDLTVQPDTDTTVAIESGHTPDIRIIASTMPRKLSE